MLNYLNTVIVFIHNLLEILGGLMFYLVPLAIISYIYTETESKLVKFFSFIIGGCLTPLYFFLGIKYFYLLDTEINLLILRISIIKLLGIIALTLIYLVCLNIILDKFFPYNKSKFLVILREGFLILFLFAISLIIAPLILTIVGTIIDTLKFFGWKLVSNLSEKF